MKNKTTYIQKHLNDEEKCAIITEYFDKKKQDIIETDSILQDIRETSNSSGDESKAAVQVTKTSKQYLKDSLPSVVDFAVYAGVTKQTIYNWYDKGMKEGATDLEQYFSFKLDSLRDLSEKAIIDARNKGYIDPIFAKFLLSAWHGYAEKTETKTEIETKDITPPESYVEMLKYKHEFEESLRKKMLNKK